MERNSKDKNPQRSQKTNEEITSKAEKDKDNSKSVLSTPVSINVTRRTPRLKVNFERKVL